jgi:hypothetical protein
MTMPWETHPAVFFGIVEPQDPLIGLKPIELKFFPARPELRKSPLTGLYPGQNHPLDIPDFLRRVHQND